MFPNRPKRDRSISRGCLRRVRRLDGNRCKNCLPVMTSLVQVCSRDLTSMIDDLTDDLFELRGSLVDRAGIIDDEIRSFALVLRR